MLHVEPLCVSLLDCVAVTVDFDFGVTLRLRSRCLMFFSCVFLCFFILTSMFFTTMESSDPISKF